MTLEFWSSCLPTWVLGLQSFFMCCWGLSPNLFSACQVSMWLTQLYSGLKHVTTLEFRQRKLSNLNSFDIQYLSFSCFPFQESFDYVSYVTDSRLYLWDSVYRMVIINNLVICQYSVQDWYIFDNHSCLIISIDLLKVYSVLLMMLWLFKKPVYF